MQACSGATKTMAHAARLPCVSATAVRSSIEIYGFFDLVNLRLIRFHSRLYLFNWGGEEHGQGHLSWHRHLSCLWDLKLRGSEENPLLPSLQVALEVLLLTLVMAMRRAEEEGATTMARVWYHPSQLTIDDTIIGIVVSWYKKCIYTVYMIDTLRSNTTNNSNRAQIINKIWNVFEQISH
jgi:hypothetical protein